MTGTFVGLLMIIAACVLMTVYAWPQRHQPTGRRLITWTWVLFGLFLIAHIAFSATSTGIFAYYCYLKLIETLQDIGLTRPLASGIAALAALPLVIAIGLAFSLRAWKRYLGLSLIALGVAAFSFARVIYADELTFTRTGATDAGYTILINGRVKRCGAPGGTDSASGQPCLAMTPVVKQFLDEAHEREPKLFVDKPAAFFNLANGEPIIWHCERHDGKYHFVRIPIRDPATGQLCNPITPEIVKLTGLPLNGTQTVEAGENDDLFPSGPPIKKEVSAVVEITPLMLPFVEDYTDGEYGALHVAGKFDLKNCGETRCLCTQGTGPWSFTLNLNGRSAPMTFSLGFWVKGEGWQSEILYMRTHNAPVIRFSHNWRQTDGRTTSCIGGTCISPVPLNTEWWYVTSTAVGNATETSKGRDAYYEEYTASGYTPCNWGLIRSVVHDIFSNNSPECEKTRLVSGSWSAETMQGFSLTAQQSATSAVINLASGVLEIGKGHGTTDNEARRFANDLDQANGGVESICLTFRQPYESQFCLGAVKLVGK